jgi:two-component system chemotaxis response regulator CheB
MGEGSRNIVIIGSSTGGTRILERVFSRMPRLNGAVVVVHQMVKQMNPILQHRLQARTKMDVVMAYDELALEHGKLYIAPSDIHLKIANNSVLQLTEGERVNRIRPSADVAMGSLMPGAGSKIVGVILTGAGEDGATGIVHVKVIGGLTIAQDEKSSPLATMPKAAVRTGKVDLVLDPEEIREKLIEVCGCLSGDRSDGQGPVTGNATIVRPLHVSV